MGTKGAKVTARILSGVGGLSGVAGAVPTIVSLADDPRFAEAGTNGFRGVLETSSNSGRTGNRGGWNRVKFEDGRRI